MLEVHNSLIKEIPLRKDQNDLLRAGMRVPVIRKHLKDSCFTFLEQSNQKILSSWDFIWKNSFQNSIHRKTGGDHASP